MKLRTLLYLLLVIFNSISIFFIIRLFGYDEVIGYVHNGSTILNHRGLAYLLFVTSLLNLYFLFFVLMERFFKQRT